MVKSSDDIPVVINSYYIIYYINGQGIIERKESGKEDEEV